MKVLSIGGGGGMGRTTARTALGFPFVEEIVLAGIDHERADRFARSLNDPRIRAIYLDITDENALRQAIRQCDVVLNLSLIHIFILEKCHWSSVRCQQFKLIPNRR